MKSESAPMLGVPKERQNRLVLPFFHCVVSVFSYWFNFFLNPASPAKPKPSNRMGAGIGTALNVT